MENFSIFFGFLPIFFGFFLFFWFGFFIFKKLKIGIEKIQKEKNEFSEKIEKFARTKNFQFYRKDEINFSAKISNLQKNWRWNRWNFPKNILKIDEKNFLFFGISHLPAGKNNVRNFSDTVFWHEKNRDFSHKIIIFSQRIFSKNFPVQNSIFQNTAKFFSKITPNNYQISNLQKINFSGEFFDFHKIFSDAPPKKVEKFLTPNWQNFLIEAENFFDTDFAIEILGNQIAIVARRFLKTENEIEKFLDFAKKMKNFSATF